MKSFEWVFRFQIKKPDFYGYVVTRDNIKELFPTFTSGRQICIGDNIYIANHYLNRYIGNITLHREEYGILYKEDEKCNRAGEESFEVPYLKLISE